MSKREKEEKNSILMFNRKEYIYIVSYGPKQDSVLSLIPIEKFLTGRRE